MSYQITGNKIPVTKEELINYIHSQLAIYDQGNRETNPYNEPIIYTTKDGKTIQVPTEIHNEAVKTWEPKLPPIITKTPKRKRLVETSKKVDYITLAILIFAAILTIYLYLKIDQGKIENPVFDQNIRYFLTK